MIQILKIILRIVLFGVSIALLATVLVFIIGGQLSPTSHLGQQTTVIFPLVMPYLVIAGSISLIISLFLLKQNSTLMSKVVLGGAVLTVLSGLVVNLQFVSAVRKNGGSVNYVNALNISADEEEEPDQTINYKATDKGDLSLSIYSPEEAADLPVMLYIHGGGWTTGDADQSSHDLRWFADNGWLVVSPNYRLATEEFPTWDKAIVDVADALDWVQQHIEREGGNSGKIVLGGDSAGGNLALLLGYSITNGDMETMYSRNLEAPFGVWGRYPATDVEDTYHYSFKTNLPEFTEMAESYIGGIPSEYPERIEAVTPATYLSESSPQTLIIHGEKDSVVTVASVRTFVEQAKNQNVDIQYAELPYSNHGFDFMKLGQQATRSIVQDFFRTRNTFE